MNRSAQWRSASLRLRMTSGTRTERTFTAGKRVCARQNRTEKKWTCCSLNLFSVSLLCYILYPIICSWWQQAIPGCPWVDLVDLSISALHLIPSVFVRPAWVFVCPRSSVLYIHALGPPLFFNLRNMQIDRFAGFLLLATTAEQSPGASRNLYNACKPPWQTDLWKFSCDCAVRSVEQQRRSSQETMRTAVCWCSKFTSSQGLEDPHVKISCPRLWYLDLHDHLH